MAYYENQIARYYNKKVQQKEFKLGDLMFRKVFQNTEEQRAGKFRANWEGPYNRMHIILGSCRTLGRQEVAIS